MNNLLCLIAKIFCFSWIGVKFTIICVLEIVSELHIIQIWLLKISMKWCHIYLIHYTCIYRSCYVLQLPYGEKVESFIWKWPSVNAESMLQGSCGCRCHVKKIHQRHMCHALGLKIKIIQIYVHSTEFSFITANMWCQ